MSDEHRKPYDDEAFAGTPYDDFCTHEVFHTCHVMLDMFSTHVLDSRCAEEFPDVKAKAERVFDAISDLYNTIGAKYSDDDK